jgi:hypothetical protein
MGATVYLAKKGEARELWMPLGYFALMELLQAFTYTRIGQCSLASNKAMTLLGYIHVMFQPFFVNMIAMHFIPESIKRKIAAYVYGLCGAGVALFTLKLLDLPGTGLCHVGAEPFCGAVSCSMNGNWHIAWQLPLNDLLSEALAGEWIRGLHSYTYLGLGFALPVLYGSWRFTLVTFLLGPFIALLSTDNVNEFPAVWCLYSIALCLTVIKSPIRRYLRVSNWIFYPAARDQLSPAFALSHDPALRPRRRPLSRRGGEAG